MFSCSIQISLNLFSQARKPLYYQKIHLTKIEEPYGLSIRTPIPHLPNTPAETLSDYIKTCLFTSPMK